MKKIFAAIIAMIVPAAGGDVPATFQVNPRHVTVVPVGGWHINEDFPWRALSHSGASASFHLRWNEASADLPPGNVTVMGGVCSLTTCVAFKKDLKVPK